MSNNESVDNRNHIILTIPNDVQVQIKVRLTETSSKKDQAMKWPFFLCLFFFVSLNPR